MTSGSAQPRFSEDDAHRAWLQVAGRIDALAEGGSEEAGSFRVQPRSSLAEDDARTAPCQLSHAVGQCVTAAVDHLHAIKSLVVDLRMIHVAAPASLARGVLENAATAYWMLHPASRSERLTRCLRWWVKNFQDQQSALGHLDLPASGMAPRERLERIKAQARTLELNVDTVMSGYSGMGAVRYAETHSVREGHTLFPWQLCSGFAHGRPWAYLGISEREEFPTGDDDVVTVRLTNTLDRSLYPTVVGLGLLQELLELRALRAMGR